MWLRIGHHKEGSGTLVGFDLAYDRAGNIVDMDLVHDPVYGSAADIDCDSAGRLIGYKREANWSGVSQPCDSGN